MTCLIGGTVTKESLMDIPNGYAMRLWKSYAYEFAVKSLVAVLVLYNDLTTDMRMIATWHMPW